MPLAEPEPVTFVPVMLPLADSTLLPSAEARLSLMDEMVHLIRTAKPVKAA